jgi:hypothetical protein
MPNENWPKMQWNFQMKIGQITFGRKSIKLSNDNWSKVNLLNDNWPKVYLLVYICPEVNEYDKGVICQMTFGQKSIKLPNDIWSKSNLLNGIGLESVN